MWICGEPEKKQEIRDKTEEQNASRDRQEISSNNGNLVTNV